jgi:hypothetical protein
LARFDDHTYASIVIEKTAHDGYETALLFPLGSGAIHVVGNSQLAGHIRSLLRLATIGDWRLHELPQPTTPLRALRSQIDARFYNLLCRNGFTTVEEAAAAPDEGLRQLRNVGLRFLAALRAVTGEPQLTITNPTAAEQARERRAYLDERLSVPAVRRYHDFADALARSSIPPAALEKIADALNAETVPPSDPTVTLLLETAREQQLLEYYLGTHHNSPTR